MSSQIGCRKWKKVVFGTVLVTIVLAGDIALSSRSALGSTIRVAPAATQPPGGVVLDGWGGLHPFGGVTINSANAPYWRGWDIARSIVVLPDGSGGWTLDGWGVIHAWGTAPTIASPAYWHGQDIARALVILADHRSGYVLDGWGGLHPFGNAPRLLGVPYWPGWDIARGFAIHINAAGVPDGGWTLDAWGCFHNFGNAPSLPSPHYFRGFDFWQRLHVTGNGAGAMLVGRYGIVDSSGHPGGISWSGFPTWGSSDIVRDVYPINPTGGWSPQPISYSTASALMVRLNNWDRSVAREGPLAENTILDGIAGNGGQSYEYNLASCGGPGYTIFDRSHDMFVRNYFGHSIPGCRGTRYVFDTYYPTYGIPSYPGGEIIAWVGGITSLEDAAWWINEKWLASSDHYPIITSKNFGQIGCGVYFSPSGPYLGHAGPIYIWTCDFH